MSRTPDDRRWVRHAQRELRALLNDWDPIGVLQEDEEPVDAEFSPVDEYDCLRDPLLGLWAGGADRLQVAAFLRRELTDHFGLTDPLVPLGFIERLFDWWAKTAPRASSATSS